MKKSINFLAAIAILFCVSSCDSLHESDLVSNVPSDPNKKVYFADVNAIFNANGGQCSQCHFNGSATPGKIKNSNGKNVDVDVYADVKLWVNTPDYKNSYLYLAVNPLVKGSLADMTKNATSLSKAQIAIINKWLDDGALEK